MKRKRGTTLRKKLLYSSMLAIVLSMVIFSAVCYILLSSNARRAQTAADDALVRQTCENTAGTVKTVEIMIRNICYSDDIQKLLLEYRNYDRGPVRPQAERARFLLSLRLSGNRAFSNFSNANRYFYNMVLFSPKGEVLGSMNQYDPHADATAYDWYDSLMQTSGESLWLEETSDPNNRNDTYTHFVPVVKKVRGLGGGPVEFGADLGYLLIYIHPDIFVPERAFSSHANGSILLLATQDGSVLGSQYRPIFGGSLPFDLGQTGSGQIIQYQGRDYLLTVRPTRVNGWHGICLSDYDWVMRDANVAIGISLLVALLLMIVFFINSRRNANLVVEPVTALREAFHALEKGDFGDVSMPATHIQELDDLTASYAVMVHQLDTLVNDVYQSNLKAQQLRSEVQQTQIEALQMQINPHFIYNTLDSINWMALMAGQEDIGSMAQSLGDFLRFNISLGQLYCTLQDEVTNTQRFMYIQHMRFAPRLEYSFQVPQELYGYKVLKLLLQPLVENAIKHGVEPLEGACQVEVEVSLEGDRLRICVQDDGAGMTGEKWQEISSLWRSIVQGQEQTASVGLSNLMKRLYLCYGDAAHFEVESGSGFGTAIRIWIPAEVYPGEEKDTL